jgi:Zn-dependent protease with chaperone function
MTSAVLESEVRPWPTERPLHALCAVVAALIWLIAVVSIIGIVYAAILGAFFFVAHAAFVAHIRGSAVKLGPSQFPQLYEAVERLARRIGLDETPDTYLMQSGGALNAFATRFLGLDLVVLYSDLLDACGDNDAARDMIIAHELGHVRAGHLKGQWFLLPALLVPFLGTALSRAREYTCDRYGAAGAADRDGALLGLTILAAGGRHAPRVDRRVMVAQHGDLNTGWMTIGQWLSTHPPLLKRMAALDPSLAPADASTRAGSVRALAIVGAVVVLLGGVSWLAVTKLGGFMQEVRRQQAAMGGESSYPSVDPTAEMDSLRAFVLREGTAGVPVDVEALYERWAAAHPGQPQPLDPFDGQWYGYLADAQGFTLYSSGPDGKPETDDDIVLRTPLPGR